MPMMFRRMVVSNTDDDDCYGDDDDDDDVDDVDDVCDNVTWGSRRPPSLPLPPPPSHCWSRKHLGHQHHHHLQHRHHHPHGGDPTTTMTITTIPPSEKIRKHLKGELYRGELLFEAGQSLLHYVLPVNNIYLAWTIFVLPGQQYMSCLDVIFNWTI